VLLQGTEPGILGGIIKGFKGRKVPHTEDFIPNPKVNFSHLEGIFLKSPFSDSSPAVTDNQEAEELNIGFDLSTCPYTVFLFVVFLVFTSLWNFGLGQQNLLPNYQGNKEGWFLLSSFVWFFLVESFSWLSFSVDFFSLYVFGTDDIEIDEPLPAASSSSHDFQNIKTGKSDFLIFI